MVDKEALYKLFKEIPAQERCLYTDTFATCCYLHKQNEVQAARKLLTDLFIKINSSGDHNQSLFLNSVIDTLPGNEKKYAMAVPLRAEFRKLFGG